ncbi:MAG: winged helix-turn-helix domain-containing protein, partial [Candidatus Bipolaricaulota bacterium]
MLRIRLLGRFEVVRDGEPIEGDGWRRRKNETLLKVLLSDPGKAFSQDQLIEALFAGENPRKAVQNLHARVSQLRRVLEPGLDKGTDSTFILRQGQAYRFDPSADCWIDAVAFAEEVGAAHVLADQESWGEASERFEEALGLCEGEFLPSDRYEEWSEARRSELHDLHLEGLSRLAECYEQLGRLRQAITCCQRILAVEPHRESVVR